MPFARNPFATIITLILLIVPAVSAPITTAQENLLNDPGFEGEYSARGREDFNIPDAWGEWWTDTPRTAAWMNQPPIAFPHTQTFKRSGAKSLSIERGSATFTAAIFQQIPNMADGTPLQASAFVLLRNDNPEANTRARIGIGAGTDPNNESIIWSQWETAIDEWQQITVSAAAPDGITTVFIYFTQDSPGNSNAVYVDDASLIITEAPSQDSEPVIHVVQEGDTLLSIALLYGVEVDDLRRLNNIQGEIIIIGQEILIRDAQTNADNGQISQPDEPTITTQEPPDDAGVIQPALTGSLQGDAANLVAPPAPVISEAHGVTALSDVVIAIDSSVCVILFEDLDMNRIRQASERLLANGKITFQELSGSRFEETYETDGTSEPYCFENLQPGYYTITATAPEGYGLTTPSQLRVEVKPGTTFTTNFGAAQGIQIALPPTPDTEPQIATTPSIAPTPATPSAPVERLLNVSGFLVLGLAGITLVFGLGLSLILRQR